MPSVVTPVLVVVAVLVLTTLWQRRLSQGYDYQCGRCGHRFSPSPLAAALAPHRFGGLKLLKCPECGAFTWASVVPKE
ncbi:MAG TPA: zinc ribbon domain-containing protein [Gaiellaceae bacterium]|nr:zinc ribbon domain-containing protein [Gaiellaceae bacterium]